MSMTLPLVSVITAVYNGEKYLVECIESVLTQTYENWEYVIVNNCSTDKTLEIAQAYANRDMRIRVMNNLHHVGAIENHNIALRYISAQSKYCKVVCADDWLYPECIQRMVQLAEEYSSVAIVGSYAIRGGEIAHVGLPPERSLFNGREVCRFYLLDGVQVMGAPTTMLYRSDIVRSETRFFPGPALSADLAACFRSLQHYDFGFVHQVLAFLRLHDEALSVEQGRLRAFRIDRVAIFANYGRIFLSEEEFVKHFAELLDDYYDDVLASAFIKRYPKEFWNYHKSRLEEIGVQFSSARLLKSFIFRLIDLLGNPKQTIEKTIRGRRI